MTTVRPFLMFQGDAEEAIEFYASLFPDTEIVELTRYRAGEPGQEGRIKRATVVIGDQTLIAIDSAVRHDFTFTPSFSLFVDCDSEDQIAWLFEELSEGGKIFVPLDTYGFSRRFGWVQDRFGVSWQLTLG